MTTKMFLLKNVRITFPKLFKDQAEAFGGKGDPYYSASFLLAPDHPQIKELKQAIRAAAVAKWNDKADGVLKVLAAKDKLPIHDGALKSDKPYGAAYQGMLYVSARNNAKTSPPVPVYDKFIDPATGKARVITDPNDPRAPYSGAYVNVYLNFFGYSNEGEGIGAGIGGVQFAADGERLSGGVAASADDFQAVADDAADASSAVFGKGDDIPF